MLVIWKFGPQRFLLLRETFTTGCCLPLCEKLGYDRVADGFDERKEEKENKEVEDVEEVSEIWKHCHNFNKW